ncbi:MAG: hypothetical protein ACI4KM_02940 [Oscillospiraceae bacterium]
MLSLLYPDNYSHNGIKLDKDVAESLELPYIAMLICPYNTEYALGILTELITDESVIRWRQDVLQDFINVPQLERNLRRSIKTIYDNAHSVYAKSGSTQSFYEIQENISAIEAYTACMTECHEFIQKYGSKLHSEGIKRVLAEIDERYNSDSFKELINDVAQLKTAISEGIKSVTFSVNFDSVMRPTEIMLISADKEPVRKKSRFERLIFHDKSIEPISTIYTRKAKEGQITEINSALFTELDALCGGYMKRLNTAIKSCYEENADILVRLSPQIDFFIGAKNLTERAQQMGLPYCRPIIAPTEQRKFCCKGMHDPVLTNRLLSERVRENNIVPVFTNDCTMDNTARLLILSGTNNGGKTTYLRGAGLNQILAQAGLFVYAQSAEISLCDRVFFLSPKEEKAGINTSRFTEECKDIRRTINLACANSLILMNESLSSTNLYDSLLLAEEVLRILADIGCRLIFTTHILELADLPEKLNPTDVKSRLASLVALCDENGLPTYQIVAGKPDRARNAQYIFSKFGISFEEYISSK